MIDIKLEHINNGYAINLSNNKEKDILVAEMPKNVLLNLPEMTTIYEVETEQVSIYRNKEKISTKKCPDYAKRTLIWAHLCRLIEDRNIANIPVITKLNGDVLKECDTLDTILPIFSLLEEPVKQKDIDLEVKLLDTISKCSKQNGNVPQDVWEGFIATFDVFKGD